MWCLKNDHVIQSIFIPNLFRFILFPLILKVVSFSYACWLKKNSQLAILLGLPIQEFPIGVLSLYVLHIFMKPKGHKPIGKS
jgi:hypothetical protein